MLRILKTITFNLYSKKLIFTLQNSLIPPSLGQHQWGLLGFLSCSLTGGETLCYLGVCLSRHLPGWAERTVCGGQARGQTTSCHLGRGGETWPWRGGLQPAPVCSVTETPQGPRGSCSSLSWLSFSRSYWMGWSRHAEGRRLQQGPLGSHRSGCF